MLGRLAGASAARAAGARHAHDAQNTTRRAAGSRPTGELALVMNALAFKRRRRSDSRRAEPHVKTLVRASLPRSLLQVPTPDVLVGPGAGGAAVGAEADDLVGVVVPAGAVVLVVVAPRVLGDL